ncbi:MAG: molybdenum cofactor sulfurtransferase [Chitinophagales bacterium]|jgi:molybdenum cofactor sulfurtransferase
MEVGTSKQPNLLKKDELYFELLRQKDFARLDANNQVYFDFTGGNLYPESLIDQHYDYLKNKVLGNPHSTNPTSQLSSQKVEEARNKVLTYFNAQDDYFCVFTANASAALKIVGECYPFQEDSSLVLFADNHNSVNGLREFCKSKKASYEYCPMFYDNLRVDEQRLSEMLVKHSARKEKLLAFPAQSNVSGVKHDLKWIDKAQNLAWDVLLDAAAYVPTSPLDLKAHPANFVSVSFYKIFGFPTGIGCLFIRKDTFNKLQKPWFAGGTVAFAAVNEPMFKLIKNHERFEDGTINYLQIPAIKNGLDYIEEIGIARINQRVEQHTAFLLQSFKNLKHSNGANIIGIYGPKDTISRGGTIIFNVLDKEGHPIPFTTIEEEANKLNISIRTGCFCNPGVDEINNCLTSQDIAKYYTAREDASYLEMINFLGKMRGAVRISVGFITNQKDLDILVKFLKGFSA